MAVKICAGTRYNLLHASNLGALIAYAISEKAHIPAYIYDGVTVDEMLPILKVTGLTFMEREGRGHNLNMRAAAMRYAREHHKAYKDCTLIVVHLGGGISVSLHHDGKVADIIKMMRAPSHRSVPADCRCFR